MNVVVVIVVDVVGVMVVGVVLVRGVVFVVVIIIIILIIRLNRPAGILLPAVRGGGGQRQNHEHCDTMTQPVQRPVLKNCKKAVVHSLWSLVEKAICQINNSSIIGHKTDLGRQKGEHFPIAQPRVRLLGNTCTIEHV